MSSTKMESFFCVEEAKNSWLHEQELRWVVLKSPEVLLRNCTMHRGFSNEPERCVPDLNHRTMVDLFIRYGLLSKNSIIST
jgi:hypothetical protein